MCIIFAFAGSSSVQCIQMPQQKASRHLISTRRAVLTGLQNQRLGKAQAAEMRGLHPSIRGTGRALWPGLPSCSSALHFRKIGVLPGLYSKATGLKDLQSARPDCASWQRAGPTCRS